MAFPSWLTQSEYFPVLELKSPISETNWLNYFQNLHSNKPLTSDQQRFVSELRKREDTVMQQQQQQQQALFA